MNAYKKFGFDNFEIEENDEIVVPLAETETPAVPEEVAPLPEIPVEPIEEVKTYTEDELAEAKLEAEKQGYGKGYQAKSEEIDNQLTGLLVTINDRLAELLAKREQDKQEIERSFINLNLAVVKKMLPQMIEENANTLVTRFLEENFPNFSQEDKLSFYFNEGIIKQVQEKIADLARLQDFEGKIALHKDNNLGLADCRIEWENGGVDFKADKILEKVDNLLEEKPSDN